MKSSRIHSLFTEDGQRFTVERLTRQELSDVDSSTSIGSESSLSSRSVSISLSLAESPLARISDTPCSVDCGRESIRWQKYKLQMRVNNWISMVQLLVVANCFFENVPSYHIYK